MPEVVARLLLELREDSRRAESDMRLLLGVIHSYHRTLKLVVSAARLQGPLEREDQAEAGRRALEMALQTAEEWLADAGNVLDIT